MKANLTKLVVLTVTILFAHLQTARAQTPEVEPNNTFATVNQMPYGTTITGQVGCSSGDPDDYFRVVLPAGTKSLRLITKTKTVSGTGGVYYYLYNKYQQQLTNYYQSLTTTWLTDTLNYPCFEGDTFYVRIYNWTGGSCKDYEITPGSPGSFLAGADVEGNDAFTSAQPLAFNFDTSGHLGNQKYSGSSAVQDAEDHYRVIAPTGNRGLRIVSKWRAATPGGTGGAYCYLYNKYQQQLTNNYVSFGNAWVADTLDYPCFQGDTFYVRMYSWTGDCKEYRFRATTPNVFTVAGDVENNDAFTTATPIPFGVDSAGHLANQKYVGTGAPTDAEDFYRIVPPATNRGLRLITRWRAPYPGHTGGAYVYLYNKYQQQLTNNYVTFGNTWKADTLDYPCFEGDTFYVRMYNWTGQCKEYTFNAGTANSFVTVYDPEPNDNFATATPLAFGADTTGHLGNQRYGATNPYTDAEDFYRIIAPAGNRSLRLLTQWRAASPGGTGGVYVYLYNKAQQQLTNNYVSFGDVWKADTLDYPCFEGDTFYVRCYNWTGGCKEYHVRNTTTGFFTFAGDAEPNNSLTTATPLAFRTNTTGTLATQVYGPTSIYTDPEDYYRVVMPNNDRGIRVIVNARTPKPGATGAFYLYIYNKAGTHLTNKYVAVTNTLKADTLEFPCFTSDTFYVRVYNWSGDCKEYSLRTEYASNGPIYSAFERTRFGSSFSFVNRSRNATSYLWTFGDGATDTTAYPVHTYGPGVHPVRLRATGFCGLMDSRDTLKVQGIEYFTPKSAAAVNGFGFFNLRFFGAGLDSQAVVRLRRGGNVLQPARVKSPSEKELNLLFNIRGADTGLYDVEITLSNAQTFSYPASFRIFSEDAGFGITTQLNGPTTVRTGTWTNYSLVVKNNKSSMANGVSVYIAVPRGVETNIQDVLHKKTGVQRIAGSDWNMLTIDREYFNQVYFGGTFDPAAEVVEMDYNALNAVFDSTVRITTDSLFGKAFNGTLYPIYVPMIAGNGTWQIAFKMRAGANGNYTPVAYASPFTAHINPTTGDMLTYVHDGGLAAAGALEFAPNPAAKFIGRNAGRIDIGSQVAFTEFFDWYYGVNVADDDYYARQGVALAGEVIGDRLVPGDGVNASLRKVDQAKDNIRHLNKHANMTEDFLRNDIRAFQNGKVWDNAAQNVVQLRALSRQWENALPAWQREAVRKGFEHLAKKYGINKATDALGNWLFPEDMFPKPVNSVTSMDPNAIYGNWGPKLQQYLRRDADLSYLITFENVDTALAPAAVVRVETQLDTNKFDLRSASLGNVTIGERLYLVEPDRREYFRDIDLRPAKNLIVRVNAHMDTTGRAYWEFTSLDPATMDIPEDPTVGFLPPNVTKPEGEGSVSFFAKLKPGVSHRDSFSAQAKIVFDFNDPIWTAEWKNTVDEQIPTVTVSPNILLTDDSVMTLSLTGDDAESGLHRYAIYVKMDTAWQPDPLNFYSDEAARIVGVPGHTYSFYAVGKDSVGNKQFKPQTAEASITIPVRENPLPPVAEGLFVYPNPTRSIVNLALNVPDEGALTLTFTTASGARALEWNAGHPGGPARYTVVLGSLAPGVYFVKAAVGGKMVGEARLVVVP